MKRKTNKPPRLVKIDCRKLLYSVYDGRTLETKVSSDSPMDDEWIEYLRVNTHDFMQEIESSS